jgi:hypothetical protein
LLLENVDVNKKFYYQKWYQPRCLVFRVSDYWSGFDSRFCHGDFSLKGKISMVTIVWVVYCLVTRHNTAIHNILSTAPQLSIFQKALRTLPEDGNVMPKHVGATIHN